MSIGAGRWAVLAQAAEDLLGQVLPWLIMLIGVVIVGGLGIYFVRRMLRTNQASSQEGFTLHELRCLHAEDRLSDEEFERAKALIIGRATGSSSPEGAIGSQGKDRETPT